MLRRIAYPYLPPLCSLSILPPYSSGYVEIGTSPLVKLSYTINKRSLPTQTTILSYMIPGNYPAITSAGQSTVSGTVSGVVITPVTSATSSFTITVNDELEDIEIKTKDYNTTLGTLIDLFLQHNHMTTQGLTEGPDTGVPPVNSLSFKGGDL